METLKMYSVYDTKSQSWMTPITDTAEGFHKYISFLVNDLKNECANYPEDFMVFELGEYNILDGKIHLLDEKRALTSLSSYKTEVITDE